MENLHFAHPWMLLGLLLLPLWAVWHRRRPSPTIRYSDTRLVQGLPRSWRQRLMWLPTALRYAALTLLILAIARPQASREQQTVRGKGVDIVLALDMSGSMAALDFEPDNRLEAAKGVIDEFITERRYDRIGLVVFAREAFAQCPPTFDDDVLRQLLASVELASQNNLEDGTAIGMGIAQAASMLQNSDAKSRVIILLTDGVNNSGMIDPITAAQLAQAIDIKVYTIGMGKPGQVPFPAQSPWGQQTQMMDSEVDEETLQTIADTTGAAYFRATDTAGLQQIYQQISDMEKTEMDVEVYVRYKELAGYMLIPALALLLAERLIRETVLRRLP